MKSLITGIVTVAIIASSLLAAEATKDAPSKDKKKVVINCPVSGKAAKKDVTVDYKVGKETYKVQVCCGNCAKAFTKDSKKFASKANMQLVATKQFEQKACPFSGKPGKKDATVKVGGVKVAMCCGNCTGKVEKEKDIAKQIEMIFNDKSFAKGFAVKKKSEKKSS